MRGGGSPLKGVVKLAIAFVQHAPSRIPAVQNIRAAREYFERREENDGSGEGQLTDALLVGFSRVRFGKMVVLWPAQAEVGPRGLGARVR